ncbi:MAG: M50 family metallopeptidase [Bacillota bacterium]
MFKNSITIFKISDIPIKLHISFLLVLPFLAVAIGNNTTEIAKMAGVAPENLSLNPYGLGFILAVLLFISVGLHELSHSFVARSKGIEINNITLMLLGGVAQMNDDAKEPRDEAWMAFAGPLFSLVFGLSLFFILLNISDMLFTDLRVILYYLGFMNIFLAVFNLLPAFPSDGGRILRSLIARKTSYLKATKIATSVGKFFALLFGFVGLLGGNIILILIAFFIYIGASQEYQSNVIKTALQDFTVSDLMTEDVSTINGDLTISHLMDKIMEERHSGYPVVDQNGNLTGCVTMEDIKSVPQNEHREKRIKDVMTCEVITVSPDDGLFEAFRELSRADIGRVMVVENGDLVGILTRSDIMKGYQLKMIEEQK